MAITIEEIIMERIEEKMDQEIEILVERVSLRRLKPITTNPKRLFMKRRKVLRPLKIKKKLLPNKLNKSKIEMMIRAKAERS